MDIFRGAIFEVSVRKGPAFTCFGLGETGCCNPDPSHFPVTGPSAKLSLDLEQGEVGNGRGGAKEVENARREDLKDISRWMWVGKGERMLFAACN